MNPLRIVRVPILPFHIVNAYLVIGADGCILVDAGLPGSEKQIARALADAGRSFADIRLIVVTHAHIDHAGNAARLRELTGAPIVAHRGDLAHYRGEVPMTFSATGLPGRLFYATKAVIQPYPAFTPDLFLDETELSLAPYGIPGKLVATLGHTQGSTSVVLTGGDALVGDLVASGILIGGITRLGHAIRPPFEDDPRAVAEALVGLLDAGAARFHLGHGGVLPAVEVRRHADRLRVEASRALPASSGEDPDRAPRTRPATG